MNSNCVTAAWHCCTLLAVTTDHPNDSDCLSPFHAHIHFGPCTHSWLALLHRCRALSVHPSPLQSFSNSWEGLSSSPLEPCTSDNLKGMLCCNISCQQHDVEAIRPGGSLARRVMWELVRCTRGWTSPTECPAGSAGQTGGLGCLCRLTHMCSQPVASTRARPEADSGWRVHGVALRGSTSSALSQYLTPMAGRERRRRRRWGPWPSLPPPLSDGGQRSGHVRPSRQRLVC